MNEMNSKAKPKVIILGAGPNGLTAASYLSQAGCDVVVVEKNVETGGGLVTQELSGFKMNYHANYMMLAEQMPPYNDLNLREKGVSFIRPDEQVSFLFDNKKSLTFYTDIAKTVESVKRISEKDATIVGKLLNDCREMCDAFLIPATYLPPLETIEQVEFLNLSDELGKRIAELGDLTPYEFLDSYKISDTRVRGALLYLNSMFGLEYDEGGMAFLTPIYIYRLTQSALIKGGSHQLSSALRRVVEDSGGSVIVNNAAVKLLFKDDKVCGVKLSDSSEIFGDVVISTLNPEQNFIQLMDAAETLKQVAENWQWETWSLFVSNIGIVGEAPKYEGYPQEVSRSLIVVMGYQSEEDVKSHIEDVRSGRNDRIAGHGTVPSIFDPLLVPDHVKLGSHHVLRWECFAPYNTQWDMESESFGKRCFEFWSEYAPNIKDSNIRVWVNWSPLDIERHIPAMKKGSIKHGAYTTLQMAYNRPSPECSSYRTPIKGFYVGGSSVHPGGMVILGAGYNVAKVVAEDLGLDVFWVWEEPDMIKKARERGYFGKYKWGEDG